MKYVYNYCVITVDADWLLTNRCSFVIGREKDPSNSEVWRLIQDSLMQDVRRSEVAREREMLLRRQKQPSPEDEDHGQVSDAEEQNVAQDNHAVCGYMCSDWLHS